MRIIQLVFSISCAVSYILLFSASSHAGQLISSQGFEGSDWESGFTGESTWGDHLARVTNNPKTGTYALRGNQIGSYKDPLTGLYGVSSPVLDWRGGIDIVSQTPGEMYFSYWFRHDDYRQNLVDDGSGEGKLVFFVDERYSTQAMYINNQLAGSSTLRLKYSNGAYSDDWARENWGYSSLYLGNANVQGGTDGKWTKFSYYVNYQENYLQIWVNDQIMKSSKHGGSYSALPSDGRIYFDPDLGLRTKGFQFFWAREKNISGSSNESGYKGGWQIDDLEVWDGMPNGVSSIKSAPASPSGISAKVIGN